MFSYFNYKKRRLLLPLLAAIALAVSVVFSPTATAKLFDGPVDVLPLEQRVSLRRGELVFLGKSGEYTSRLLLDTSIENIWSVLTDYDNFSQFLPGVISSEIISGDGDSQGFRADQ